MENSNSASGPAKAFYERLTNNSEAARQFEVQYFQLYLGELSRHAPVLGSALIQRKVIKSPIVFALPAITRCTEALGLSLNVYKDEGPNNTWELNLAVEPKRKGLSASRVLRGTSPEDSNCGPRVLAANQGLVLATLATVAFNQFMQSQSEGSVPVAALRLRKPKYDNGPYRPEAIEILTGPRDIEGVPVSLFDRFTSRKTRQPSFMRRELPVLIVG